MADVGTEAQAGRILNADRRMFDWWQRRKDFASRSLREQLFGGVDKAYIGPQQPGVALRRFEGALERGTLGKGGVLPSLKHNIGWDYFGAATKYTKAARAGGPGSVYTRVGRRMSVAPYGSMAQHPLLSMKGARAAGTDIAGGIARRARPLAGVAMSALAPAFIAYGAATSPHGQVIGGLEELAGWSVFGAGWQIGKGVSGWLGGSVAGGASKLPLIGKLLGAGETASVLGAGAGAVIGGFATSLLFFEAARWSVGFALHTLPTFAQQFQRDMGRSGFGGDFVDSAGAATMRQRSLQVIGKSFANARSALGQEASLLHV